MFSPAFGNCSSFFAIPYHLQQNSVPTSVHHIPVSANNPMSMTYPAVLPIHNDIQRNAFRTAHHPTTAKLQDDRHQHTGLVPTVPTFDLDDILREENSDVPRFLPPAVPHTSTTNTFSTNAFTSNPTSISTNNSSSNSTSTSASTSATSTSSTSTFVDSTSTGNTSTTNSCTKGPETTKQRRCPKRKTGSQRSHFHSTKATFGNQHNNREKSSKRKREPKQPKQEKKAFKPQATFSSGPLYSAGVNQPIPKRMKLEPRFDPWNVIQDPFLGPTDGIPRHCPSTAVDLGGLSLSNLQQLKDFSSNTQLFFLSSVPPSLVPPTAKLSPNQAKLVPTKPKKNQSCTSCYKARTRCARQNGPTSTCERCERLGKLCVLRPHKKKGRRPKHARS